MRRSKDTAAKAVTPRCTEGRSIRSISVPHRDVDITLNPGGNQQFSRNEILDFQADAVELEVTGNNQFITVELDSMVNNENDTLQVHTWYKLFLDNNAPAGEEYDVFVVFTYTAGDNRSVQQEAYTETVASLEADFNTDVVRGHIPLDDTAPKPLVLEPEQASPFDHHLPPGA